MEKRKGQKTFSMFCSTTAFENIRKIITETIATNYALEKTESRGTSVKVVIETIKTRKKNV